ncbi:MAG: phosphoglycerate kinase [Acidobacteriota bacterium]|nr:phosphoglycerate kinase [Acidobacteriota bacterium]
MWYFICRGGGGGLGCKSVVQNHIMPGAWAGLGNASLAGTPLVLPVDHVVTCELGSDAPSRVISIGETRPEWMGVDIGPETRSRFRKILSTAGTVLWNGPVGVFEIDRFAGGTLSLAQAAAASPATTIVGGGDSIAAVRRAGVADRITHISTGGGASLEFLSGRKLPGVESLSDRA